ATGAIARGLFPLVSRTFVPPWSRVPNGWGLVVMRSTPEYILAFVFLLLWGPSWLPAIAALAIHNGAVIAHLIGRHVDEMQLRPDAPRGLNRYFYETLPRLYGQFLAFLFYRWEVILRESAILGILGIHTLGFYIDSALADDRQDRALLLILLTAALNLAVDALSRRLRARLRLKLTPEME
ncbi:MAG: ABC transporter permease, partial [SAR324 cluster bacterium]|nr:ABC transporter permease [SAR324 cluster bacterium]